ncbi:MAG: CU044_2847 family protein [Halobacteriota archaeon]
MAKQLIEYDYQGTSVLVEVDEEAPEEGFERAGFDIKDRIPFKKANVSLDQAFSTIKPTAQAITDQIQALSIKPQKAEVGFGLTMKANAGAVLASAGVEANVNVKLTWDFGGQ